MSRLFRELFCDTMPSTLCLVIEQNSTCERIVHAAMYSMRLFFDPDQCQYRTCRTENTDKATFFALNLCLSILQSWGDGSVTKPLYLIAEAASLLGNLYGSHFGPDLVQSDNPTEDKDRYRHAVTMMRAIVGDLRVDCPSSVPLESLSFDSKDMIHYSTLRCHCLESIAIICKAVGREFSRGETVSFLNDLTAVMQREGGLDFSSSLELHLSDHCSLGWSACR